MERMSVDEHFEELCHKDPDFRDEYLLRGLAADLATQIKAERISRGLSQGEFAKQLGTTQSRISQIEDPTYGKLTLLTLVKIANVLKRKLIVRFDSMENAVDSSVTTQKVYRQGLASVPKPTFNSYRGEKKSA
jgi:transcriptional regulator with XRE-family HTH domain